MKAFKPLLLGAAAVGCIAFGCTITSIDCDEMPNAGVCQDDPKDPPPGGSCPDPNSFLDDNECFCNAGFDWCTLDPDDLSCCQEAGTTTAGTTTAGGTGGTTTAGTGGAGTGMTIPPDCTDDPDPMGDEPNPADCDNAAEGAAFCSNTDDDGPQGARFWTCQSGAWVEDNAAMDTACQGDGFDFSYGCVDDAMEMAILFECGTGPGTDCTCADQACVDADVINVCVFGKLTSDSCTRFCQEEGDGMGTTFDLGTCQDDPFGCGCSDE